MVNLEDVGRKLDRELEKLRRFFETELRPTTERKAVEVLRTASKRLGKLAEEIESRASRAKH
ncbi:MAG TPA: hypothetical protein VI699_08530 [Candidatus Acidoferrales bacterium]|nr:hypothetical protein [Candidatus Acidoferrales bacterium]